MHAIAIWVSLNHCSWHRHHHRPYHLASLSALCKIPILASFVRLCSQTLPAVSVNLKSAVRVLADKFGLGAEPSRAQQLSVSWPLGCDTCSNT
jgi:hypothetical protein